MIRPNSHPEAELDMTNSLAYGTMPLVQLTMNAEQHDALMSADVLNEMTNQYWNSEGSTESENIPDGTYKRNGGTFTVMYGRVIEFTTACGESFTDIKYDANGEVLSLKTSSGYIWEQRNTINQDGTQKRDGYDLRLSNLTLHYQRLIVNTCGATHLNAGRPGYVSTTCIDGAKGTMKIGADGAMSGYEITLPNGRSFIKSNVPMSSPT